MFVYTEELKTTVSIKAFFVLQKYEEVQLVHSPPWLSLATLRGAFRISKCYLGLQKLAVIIDNFLAKFQLINIWHNGEIESTCQELRD